MVTAIGINNKVVNIIENMYNKTICSVVLDGNQTGWFQVVVGVGQVCLLSPTLFNLFLDFVMQEIKCLKEQVTFNNLRIDLKYAEYTTLIAAVFEHLHLSTSHWEHSCGKLGTKINADKCEIHSEDPWNLSVDETALEKEKIVFLGSLIPKTLQEAKKGELKIAATTLGIWRKMYSSEKK